MQVDLPLQLPRLTGHGVVLRAFDNPDAALVQAASSDPYITSITTVPSTPDPVEALAFIGRQRARLADGVGCSFAIATEDELAVGQIGLWPLPMGRASVGYWIGPRHRKHGLAVAALQTLTEWASGLPGLHRLELYVEPWNIASRRTAERVGFEQEGLMRSWKDVGGSRRDMYMYALLP